MREIVLKKDVLNMIYSERVNLLELKESGAVSDVVYAEIDNRLTLLYHKIQFMGMTGIN